MFEQFYIDEKFILILLSRIYIYIDSYPRLKKKKERKNLELFKWSNFHEFCVTIIISSLQMEELFARYLKPRTGTRPETPSNPWSSQIQPSRSSHTSHFHATISKMLSFTERAKARENLADSSKSFHLYTNHSRPTKTSPLTCSPYNNIWSNESEEKNERREKFGGTFTFVKREEKKRRKERKNTNKTKSNKIQENGIQEKRFKFEIQIQHDFTETRGRNWWVFLA